MYDPASTDLLCTFGAFLSDRALNGAINADRLFAFRTAEPGFDARVSITDHTLRFHGAYNPGDVRRLPVLSRE